MSEYPIDLPYWYYLRCPLHGDCSNELWKKWKVWGYTEMDAQQQLFNHLTQSGKHLISPDEADELIGESTEFVFSEDTGARSSSAAAARPSSAASDDARLLAITAGAAENAGRLPLEARAIGARPPPAETRPTKQRKSQHAPPEPHIWPKGTERTDPTQLARFMPAQNEPTVTLRIQEFNTIIDSVLRSSQAAKSAARIAGVASATFTTESKTLDEIATTMQAMKAAAEFGSGTA